MTTRRVLLVASTGGHLTQLRTFADELAPKQQRVWLTHQTPQSESLLSGERVEYVPYVGSRDVKGAASAVPAATRVLREHGITEVISTGAALAVSAFVAARARRLKTTYIESFARFDGPSLTGRLVSAIPGVQLRTQHAAWASRRWSKVDSVLDVAARRTVQALPTDASGSRTGPLQVLVTVGTVRAYRFDSLVQKLSEVLPADAEVTWQLGATADGAEVRGRVLTEMPESELLEQARRSHVVVTHAGVGTIISLLAMGVPTVVVPRRAYRGEHVDDHQQQIANALSGKPALTVAEVDDLDLELLLKAAGRA
jgi:UDP-N-acetylglucosamine--N-acetylmuramyl-(pentapeptide) pyrophosphoryl-undecaprenol N-acetylglucosamine transferase